MDDGLCLGFPFEMFSLCDPRFFPSVRDYVPGTTLDIWRIWLEMAVMVLVIRNVHA